jgi:hypothetical protein
MLLSEPGGQEQVLDRCWETLARRGLCDDRSQEAAKSGCELH